MLFQPLKSPGFGGLDAPAHRPRSQSTAIQSIIAQWRRKITLQLCQWFPIPEEGEIYLEGYPIVGMPDRLRGDRPHLPVIRLSRI
jgi:hypothetical protein